MLTFHDLTISKTIEVLRATQNGLTQVEVDRRLKESGENRLPEDPPPGWIAIFVRQFLSPLMLILLVAMGVSLAFGDIVDGVMIGAAVVINVLVGFIQEFKANKALAHLRSFVVPTANVMRDGHQVEVEAHSLVVGDLLVLRAGNRIPADARLVSCDGFEVDEAVLTGESLPAEKKAETLDSDTALADRTNMIHSGTLVTRGQARALVTATGLNTELGKIAELVSTTEKDRSPLQDQFVRLSRFLAILYSILAIIIFAVGLLLGKSLFEMFILSVALAVAAVPEGLLVAVTIVLALGMQRMLKRKALVRRLVATETLGSVSVICTDKTGTITEASMKVHSVVAADAKLQVSESSSQNPKSIMRAARIGVLCNDAVVSDSKEFMGSPTEVALLSFGEGVGFDKDKEEKISSRIATLPFDSEHKFMLTLVESGSGREILGKGAAEIVLESSIHVLKDGEVIEMSEKARLELVHEAELMTERGLRVLGVAYKSASNNKDELELGDLSEMVFVGLVGLRDPVRESAKKTIAQAARAGVRTVIITGDHPRTALAIAEEVGLGGDKSRVCTGKELDEMTDEELVEKVDQFDVFARVEPVHKVRIVKAWRARGETVAMTGDGINDAPALKAADIGVAQGNGTDVTKQVADLVLLDNNLGTIVAAIKEGRVIFDNIRKATGYLLVNGFAEMSLILLGLIFKLPLPLIAAQILYINFITDGLPAVALTVDPAEDGIMQDPPRKRGTPIITNKVKGLIFGFGTLLTLLPFALYIYLIKNGYDLGYARTMMFAALSLETIVIVFSLRSYRHLVFQMSLFKNRFLIWSVAAALTFTLVAVYWAPIRNLLSLVPLGISDWLILSVIIVIKLIVIEFYKYIVLIRPHFKRKMSYVS